MGESETGVPYDIPYEKQFQGDGNRTCGAACLSMVYASLGDEVPQEEIWEVIAKVNRFGSLASTTHLMVNDALGRGFDAVAIKARHPIFALRCCHDAGIRVILNHRLHQDLPTGHYSVLVDISDTDVTLHDPYFGPSRRISHGELMQLWDPGANSEIAGETLIAISTPETTPPACELCQTPIPVAVPCPHCGEPVGLRPATSIGCIGEGCIVRRWMQVCCPSCDFMWDFTSAVPVAVPAVPLPIKPEEKTDEEDPFQLAKVFVALDKFCATIGAMPMLASNPMLMKQIEFMKGGKQRLTAAAAEEMANMQQHHDKRDALIQKSRQAKEARNKKLEALKTPSPPLDGKALGEELLKNLRLLR